MTITVTDPASGRQLADRSGRRPARPPAAASCYTFPDIVLQYVHYKRDELRAQGIRDPVITVDWQLLAERRAAAAAGRPDGQPGRRAASRSGRRAGSSEHERHDGRRRRVSRSAGLGPHQRCTSPPLAPSTVPPACSPARCRRRSRRRAPAPRPGARSCARRPARCAAPPGGSRCRPARRARRPRGAHAVEGLLAPAQRVAKCSFCMLQVPSWPEHSCTASTSSATSLSRSRPRMPMFCTRMWQGTWYCTRPKRRVKSRFRRPSRAMR